MIGCDRVDLASYQLKVAAHILLTKWKNNRGKDDARVAL